jgi:hypothetical protein
MMKLDWEKVLKHGIFAGLFVALLVYTMNENRNREQEYQKVIQQQTEANSKFADLIKIDLAQIKEKLAEGR